MTMILLALFALSAFAIPEKDFAQIWHRDVMPFFITGHQRTFINSQGMKLNFYSFVKAENTKTIVILPGRTEPAIKYAEIIYDLKDLKTNFYILDHQGQGASDRLLQDTHKGYVKHFINYAKDLNGWMDEVVVPETQGQDRFLIAHSMGGAIGTLYLAYGKKTFKKAVLNAPMFEINTKPYKENIGRFLTSGLVLIGQGRKYAPDRGPYIPEEDTFEKNEVTQSRARFEMAKALFVTWPELTLGGPTNRWVSQSLKATKKIDTITAKVDVPVLMLQSGLDLIVMKGRQTSFCQKHLNCRLIYFANSHHEILQEKDDIRDEALKEIRLFLK
jgi:lysophospholipase